jgi:hypothetical protein
MIVLGALSWDKEKKIINNQCVKILYLLFQQNQINVM